MFVLYDMIFNVALVLAAVIGALILPADGVSVPILVVLAIGYLLVAVLVRRRQPRDEHGRGHRVAAVPEPRPTGQREWSLCDPPR